MLKLYAVCSGRTDCVLVNTFEKRLVYNYEDASTTLQNLLILLPIRSTASPHNFPSTKLSACCPYTAPYPWCTSVSFPFAQKGSGSSQYS